MATPSEMIRRAEECRRMRRMRTLIHQEATPDSVPLARPMPTNHASYSRLMQNHDRIRTRHLSKNES